MAGGNVLVIDGNPIIHDGLCGIIVFNTRFVAKVLKGAFLIGSVNL